MQREFALNLALFPSLGESHDMASGVLRLRAFYGRQQVESGKKKVVVELRKKDGLANVSLR